MVTIADNRDRLFADAQAQGAAPLWTVMDAMVPPRPNPKAVPSLWQYSKLRPLLERAGRLVGTDEAERRVFMLVNSALEAPYTTDTLYAGLQLILPGEVARAHRHNAFALRFIVEGTGAFTAVDGERVTMERGDLVLTPSWSWHDHGNDGNAPMIWLDGLDLPVYQSIPVNFAEPYSAAQYPSTPASSVSALRYPWSEMAARLVEAPGDFSEETYLTRGSNEPVSRVIGAAAERIARKSSSPPRRRTTSAVYHVVSGRGTSRIGAQEIAWETGDTFAVPTWMPFAHAAEDETFLFRFDDRPLIDALGAYRCEEPA